MFFILVEKTDEDKKVITEYDRISCNKNRKLMARCLASSEVYWKSYRNRLSVGKTPLSEGCKVTMVACVLGGGLLKTINMPVSERLITIDNVSVARRSLVGVHEQLL